MSVSGLSTVRLWTTSPYPTPAPIVSSTKRSALRPAPNQWVASVSAVRSFAITTGMLVWAATISPNGTSTQFRYGPQRTSVLFATRPPRATPSPVIGVPPGTWMARSSVSSRTSSATTDGVGSVSGRSALAITSARSVVSTPIAESPVSLMPTKWWAAASRSSGCDGRPTRASVGPPATSTSSPDSTIGFVRRVRLPGDRPTRRDNSARDSGPSSRISSATCREGPESGRHSPISTG